MVQMTWYEAAAYCDQLSELERFPSNSGVPSIKLGKYAAGMKAKDKFWELITGYRLPDRRRNASMRVEQER